MADQPNVIIQANPGTWNKVYGKNMVTLRDDNNTSPRFVLQVWNSAGTEKLADLRQQANLEGRAHFDLQKILQSYVEPHPNLENTPELNTSEYEVLQYLIKAGYENSTGVAVIQTDSEPYIVTSGRKAFNELNWNRTDYLSEWNYSGTGDHTLDTACKALSDWEVSKTPAEITDGLPAEIVAGTPIYIQKVKRESVRTLSVINQIQVNTPGGPDLTQGLGAVHIKSYNGNTLVDNITIDNFIANGGGPNTVACGTETITEPYWVITAQSGTEDLSADITHYYVMFKPYLDGSLGCNLGSPFSVYRYDIDLGECNDFAVVDVSWLNSLGFLDYFDFQKRNDKRIQITRNEYMRTNGTWEGITYSVPTYDRGRTVFSQSAEEVWTLRTRYLTDQEAAFLENMFLSPHVNIRFAGQTDWYGVTILTSLWTERTFRKDKLFQLEIEVKLANNIQTGRG